MTTKHFEIIAEIIKRLVTDDKPYIARQFAYRLSQTNPRFKEDKFLKACGV